MPLIQLEVSDQKDESEAREGAYSKDRGTWRREGERGVAADAVQMREKR